MEEIRAPELSRCIRAFRAFLGQQNIDAAWNEMQALLRTGNPFREIVLAEKQPWPTTFREFDRVTFNGARRLPQGQLTTDLVEAARSGKILQNIERTIPPDVQAQMRARLLDLHGKAQPVLMEWGVANFFNRRGYTPAWTPVGQPGPEFSCMGKGLTFDVECKRVTRLSKERLGDRDALTLGHALLDACAAVGFEGDLLLDTPLTRVTLDDAALRARLSDLLPAKLELQQQVALGEFGTLDVMPAKGPLRPDGAREHIAARRRYRQMPSRFFSSAGGERGGLVHGLQTLCLVSPRRTTEEWLSHIESEMAGGVDQLSKGRPGLLFVQLEGIPEAKMYMDRRPFHEINGRLLAANPSLEAVAWQAVKPYPELRGEFVLGYEVFVQRQSSPLFKEGRAIPLTDNDENLR